ncbi:MAG: GH12 family glycosyl hydrolase domain-containing protein [Desulfurococcales archaeon]|jgi:hypothetical protein
MMGLIVNRRQMVNSVAVLLIILVLAAGFRGSGETIVITNDNPMAALDLNNDGVIDLFAELNSWNLKSYSGVLQMTIDPQAGIFRTEVNVTNVNPQRQINGYPEIYIGRKPWDSSYANGFGVEFPLKISNMSSFIVSFYICVESLDPSTMFNIAADAWIVRERVAFNPSTPPARGDLEIMVWLYRQNIYPAGRKVGIETITIVINGSKINATFEVWRDRSVSWGGWQYIAFIPKGWEVRCGTIAYDPRLFVKAASKYATFDISNHYLLSWEMGTEWGTKTGAASFTWTIRNFTIVPNVTAS